MNHFDDMEFGAKAFFLFGYICACFGIVAGLALMVYAVIVLPRKRA